MANFKGRLAKAFPVFSKLLGAGRPPLVKNTIITTTGAGDKTVTGIAVEDELISVLNMTALTDVTSQFTIKAANTINNTGGTAFDADTKLMVSYLTWADR